MKIAIPTIGSILDEYMNQCEVFTIFSVDDSLKITGKEILYTPEGCDCKNNIPLTMQQKGVTVMVVYKLPEHAEGVCEKYGITSYLGYTGKIEDVVSRFLEKLKDNTL
ncbi:MAG: NifB/NifX family molybdenum-iron cluster-binding protein [Bacteroidales bacterium]